MPSTSQERPTIIRQHPRPWILNCKVKLKIFCHSIYIWNYSDWSGPCPYGYPVCNGPQPASNVSQMAAKDRKDDAYFVQSVHVWHEWTKRFKGITKAEFVVLFPAKRASKLRSHAFKTKTTHWEFWEPWAGPFMVTKLRWENATSSLFQYRYWHQNLEYQPMSIPSEPQILSSQICEDFNWWVFFFPLKL